MSWSLIYDFWINFVVETPGETTCVLLRKQQTYFIVISPFPLMFYRNNPVTLANQ